MTDPDFHAQTPPSLDPTTTETAPLEVVVVTGLSGAGKNSAGRVLEDLGWFVVDNLPPALLQPMVELGARGDLRRFAAVVDVRSRAFSSDLQDAIKVLAEAVQAAIAQPAVEDAPGPKPEASPAAVVDSTTSPQGPAERGVARSGAGETAEVGRVAS